MTRKRKVIIIIIAALLTLLTLVLSAVIAIVTVDISMRISSYSDIHTAENIEVSEPYDCILVLGAGVKENFPSDMLRDRLDTAIELYKKGIAPKLLMSGDHGNVDYDEVNVMKNYAIEQGVPSEDIFMDHAGFSTYESIYRAREIFGAERVVVVSQEYHLYRALYIGRSFGLDVCGVSADLRDYNSEFTNETREIAARVKDFFYCIFKPEPTYLGEPIALTGSGDFTNDK